MIGRYPINYQEVNNNLMICKRTGVVITSVLFAIFFNIRLNQNDIGVRVGGVSG